MSARFEIFKAGNFTTWQSMCSEVAQFLDQIGRENVLSLTQSEDNGKAVIIVWYWQ